MKQSAVSPTKAMANEIAYKVSKSLVRRWPQVFEDIPAKSIEAEILGSVTRIVEKSMEGKVSPMTVHQSELLNKAIECIGAALRGPVIGVGRDE